MRILTLLLIISFSLSGCAYRFGLSDRALPGGYAQVAIPVFKNISTDVGIEPFFTNALIMRFARSRVARVTDKETAPVTLEGIITEVKTLPGSALKSGEDNPLLPDQAVITTDYRLQVTTTILLKRKSDESTIWSGSFTTERTYSAPRLTTSVVNSANATYNQNIRQVTIAAIAEEMMLEAHDRITENF